MFAEERQSAAAVVPIDEEKSVVSERASKSILFVTETNTYGGLEVHLLGMIRRFRGPGVQISILNIGPDLYAEHMDWDEPAQVSVVCKSKPMSMWKWFRAFREAKPDVVVFCCAWLGAYPWFVSVAAWLAGVDKRFSIQHLVPPPVKNVEGNSVRSALRRSIGGGARRRFGWRVPATFLNKTICVSDAVRDSLIRDYRFPAKKTITIHNGIAVSKFVPAEKVGATVRTSLGVRPDEFLLVCAARLSEQKGVDILLHAIARVLRDGVQCKCVIVGDGPLRTQLLEQSLKLGLSNQVLFEGFRADVLPYLQSANAFVLTSRSEGLPLSILEAMACGLPCIVTDVGGSAEAVTNKVDGLVVPPESVDAVADAISYLATHPVERERMSRMTRAKVCESFDIEHSVAELGRIILS